MNGKDIPGFYFDAAKKKYFKILPNHVATPESQYSHASVAKIQSSEKKTYEKSLRDERLRLQRVRRASVLSSPWCGVPLERECRISTSRSNAGGSAMYAAGLIGTMALNQLLLDITACICLRDFDDYLIGTDNTTAPCLQVVENVSLTMHDMSLLDSPVSSIAMANNDTVMVTTIGARLPAQIGLYTPEYTSRAQHKPRRLRFRSLYLHSLPNERSAFSCASNPFNSYEDMFVVGASREAMIIKVGDDRDLITDLRLNTASDVLATEWLSHSVAILGHRNGTVQLWDLRTSGTSARLKHPSSISTIKPIDSDKFIVAGIEDHTNMYDLRMPVLRYTRSHDHKSRDHQDSKSYTSTPVVHYDYSNHFTSRLGLDISTSTGVLAAADDERYINIFALNSGTLLKRFPLPDAQYNTHSPPIRNVLFRPEPHEDVLTITSGGRIYRTEWGQALDD